MATRAMPLRGWRLHVIRKSGRGGGGSLSALLVRTLAGVALSLAVASTAAAAPAVTSAHFRLDQFGYQPDEQKVCVVSDPQVGFDAPDPFTPSATLEVRRWSDDGVAFSGPAVAWNGGAVHAQSGDKCWRLDFSAITTPGSYYVFDPTAGVGSYQFDIAGDALHDALVQATRMFYYQRCGIAKDAAHALAAWSDTVCHAGAQQDLDCRAVGNPTAATSRDLSGGWHDAGDYNKYVNYADDPVHDLLAAYEDHPQAFGDDWGIPESGNGVPDVLDEARFELDWFLKMQNPDGSVLHKVSVTDYSAGSPPSSDTAPRRYAPATASATISACGAFAHAAIVFKSLPDAGSQAYSARLEAAARAAWAWLVANPGAIPSAYNNAGFLNADGEDTAYDQDTNRTCASAYLYVLTGETPFRDWFDANYANAHLLQWGYAYPFEAVLQDGLLYYGRASGATPATVAAIQAAYVGSMSGGDNLAHVTADEDAYRAYLADGDYTWGSNRTKSEEGNMYESMLVYGLDPGNAGAYRAAAAGYLAYLDGVNPMGLAYMSNMGAHGAERSTRSFYHSWFTDGSPLWDEVGVSTYGPAPGYLPGGPNPSYQPDPAYTGPPLQPPMNQPIQKSFLEWNGNWPEDSWEVTEPQCAYQGAYVRLLAAFVRPPASAPLGVSAASPASQGACVGGSATFTATASGGTPPLTWQWRHDLAPITGALASTLTVGPPLATTDAGSYDAVVTDSTGASVTSAAGTLTVGSPPGSPGASLRVSRTGADPVLAWASVADATGYDVLRCDASLARPCAPATVASPSGPPYDDATAAPPALWYLVSATDACGSTP